MRNLFLLLFCLLFFLNCNSETEPENPEDDSVSAFPGAEGGGSYITGGRGGLVYMVSRLEDNASIVGTLRWALSQTGRKIIVFNVAGVIELERPLKIGNNVSVLGQSAPGDGICIKNYPVLIEGDNVIIRFLRFRLGDEATNDAYDALTCIGRNNIMIDHCSMSWSIDECASCYDNENFTMQYCIISESLKASSHPKGNHGYGGIWGGTNATFHHNLLAHHDSRNPRFNGDRFTGIIDHEKVDFRNNVIYNWGSTAGYAGEGGYYNMINNYYKQGPSSKNAYFYRPDSNPLNGTSATALSKALEAIGEKGLWGKYYVSGNIMELKAGNVTQNWDWDGIYPNISQDRDDMENNAANREKIKEQIKLMDEVIMPELYTQSASNAYNAVLDFAGASFVRDEVDSRIISDVIDCTGKLIDSQNEVGGWPVYSYSDAKKDTDNDGMPDEWETTHGLNPNNMLDASEFTLDKNYTNLEIYLNSLVNHLY